MNDNIRKTFRKEWRESVTETLAVGVVGLVVGIGVGWWGESLIREDEARRERPGREEAADGRATSVQGGPKQPYQTWLEKLDAMGKRVVPEEIFAYFALFPLDSSGRIRPEVRDLFLLSDTEEERLNRVIAGVEERLLMAELDNLEVLGKTEDEALFLIPAFEEGVEIERAFREGILEVLGERDGNLLWVLLQGSGREDDPRRWRRFGRVDREIAFALREGRPSSLSPVAGADDGASWLLYEERVQGETPAFPGEDNRWHVEISRVAPLHREARDNKGAGRKSERFFDPETERFGYLVPHLPEKLRNYFGRR